MKKPEKQKLVAADLLKTIAEACEGLTYISETDAPVAPVLGGAAEEVNSETVSKAAIARPDAPTEQADFDQFFERLTRVRDWHGEREKKAARKFTKLERLLKENLRDLKVFRFGRVRIDIYVVGIDAHGNLAGIKTKAVET